MKRISRWFNKKVLKNNTSSGTATTLPTTDSHQLQHGGESESRLQLPTGEGKATAKVEEVNPEHVEKDSDSGTGSDVQNQERHQLSPSSPPFMMLGVDSPRIDFEDLKSDTLHQITLVINAKPLLKTDITSNPQYWKQTFLTSLSVNGPTPHDYYPLLPSVVDGTVNYTDSSSGTALSQIWTNSSLFMYQFDGSNQYVIMALNLSRVGNFYLLKVDPKAKDTAGPIVSFQPTADFPTRESNNGQVFAPCESNDKTGVHMTTQCSDGTYVLVESQYPSTCNSRFEKAVFYKALSAEPYDIKQNNGLTLSFITPDML